VSGRLPTKPDKEITMKIDGYVPPDPAIAQQQGVDFVYEMDWGTINIRSKSLNLRGNPQFAMAFKTHSDWMERRKNLSNKVSDKEAEGRFLGIMYDHGVIAWSTTIKSDGKAIESTRQNFIDLLSSDACSKVALVYFQDASDDANFRPVDKDADIGNSEAYFVGKSSGEEAEKNNSDM